MTDEAVTPTQVDDARRTLLPILDSRRPSVALVLGSGLHWEALGIESPKVIDTDAIPHLPRPSVAGHSTSWVAGTLEGVEVLIASGRVHRYEGIPMARATFGVRVLAAIGCRHLVVTNAAGGVRADFVPGTLMRITDHLNFLGDSPLVGAHHRDWGDRFVDMTDVYDAAWGSAVETAAAKAGIDLASGVYAACLGPQYETPAEVRFLRSAGADAVGMSTVPEVIVARQSGMRIFGLSLITNAAAGVTGRPLNHQEVIDAGREAASQLSRLLGHVVRATSTL
ncbi:MAG: purine-nucleoside phosphorylase [Planctomycetes bacterium]|nr:purine-nucleoside phosphorylase [Planctomycetota bacterium]